MKYRSDIDGLRAVAVSLVVLHHADIGWFPGGYIGVDVFFVISGYLITNIVYNETIAGNFSFSNFYIRRARRLMPALFAVLFVTAIIALLVLMPTDLARFGQSLIWVSLYVGNMFFWREHGGYFGGNAQEAPLLHTWSLAVEEQYYLFWPLVIVIGLKFLKPKHFGVLTLIGLVALVVLSEWATRNTIGAAYYLLPTRAFELLVGSALAIYWKKLPALGGVINHLTSTIGLVLIIASALILSPASPFPGINAIYPTLGSALLIYSHNSSSAGIGNRLLSYRPIVFLGLISYSLYLWHWPLFAYAKYMGIEQPPTLKFALVGVAGVLAYLSWKYVEQPFRRAHYKSLWSASRSLVFAPGCVVLIAAAVMIFGNGLPDRFSAELLNMDKALNSASHVERSSCHSASREFDRLPQENCLMGISDRIAQPDGLLIGDSHANHLAGFVSVIAKDAGRVIQDYTMDQCPPIFDVNWGISEGFAERCAKRNELAKSHITSTNFTHILLAASWPYYGSNRLFIENRRIDDVDARSEYLRVKFSETIEFIIANNKVPVVFDDVPSLSGVDPGCPVKRELFNQSLDCRTNETHNPFMDELLDSMEEQFPSLIRINLKEIVCKNGKCELELANVPLYLDTDHLNLEGSTRIGQHYLTIYDNPLQ